MSARLVVVGDVLLDVDLVGTATRLTPDAPVPVLEDLAEHARPGGAGLAALMAARDGHAVTLVTAIGDDEAGRRLAQLLSEADVRVVRLPGHGPTAVKQRVRAGGQSLLRLDHGTAPATVAGVPPDLGAMLETADAVLVSDYGRGVTGGAELRGLLEGLPRRVPVVWDPHPRGAVPVPGCRLVTPNEAEAGLLAGPGLGSGLSAARSPLAAAGRHAEALVSRWEAQAVAVTMGARGALLSYGEGVPVVVPAPAVGSGDTCGAGDRFASAAAGALATGRVLGEAVQDAVATAAAYVGAGGPASLRSPGQSSPDLSGGAGPSSAASAGQRDAGEVIDLVRARGGTVVATGGCFDLLHAGHVATLRAARSLGDCLVVCLNSDASVRRLKGAGRPLVPAEDRVRVLEALGCVDAVVVFEEDTPVEVLRRLRPDVWAKGGDYAGAEVPEAAVLEKWGGQVVALPYLEGRSTTRLVATAAERPTTERG